MPAASDAPAGAEPDLLLRADWVLTLAPGDAVRRDATVAVAGDRIVAVLPAEAARTRWPAVPETHLAGQALLPGLVNAHGHAAMTLLRGFADDMHLEPWLQERIWPLEARWVSAPWVADGTELAIAEMLKGGTTTFSDMYFFPEVAAAVAHRSGIRAQICAPVLRFGNAWAEGPEDAIRRGLALHDEYRDAERIRIAFGPHSTYANELRHLERIAVLSEELDLSVQIHLHETAEEVAGAVAERGERPLETVERAGLLGPRLQAVHMTRLEARDVEHLARHGVSVVHCPQSNLKLASGFCPTAALRAAGVNLALGTDGAASNNALSMFREMHVAAILAKAVAGDAAALPALEVLRAATLGGAEALGLGEETGSLEAGKAADLLAVDLGRVGAEPVYHAESQLVYTCTDACVRHVWVAGRQLVEDGRLLRMDEEDLLRRVRRWRDRVLTETDA
ncbi:MAG: TRZ/ATZ family hydrolase [Pseudomonadales bacterium]|jgi:5-methylthioadenosine/S-adenosylhomocysteine deaminase|nr:TRZ/ATZ family hydrolase [Pseudomonadales bacterium]